MEVRIGVQHATRELTIDTELDAEGIEKAVAEAVAGDGLLVLSDSRGRRIVVPAAKLGYVEISSSVTGQVGFRS